MWIRVGNVLINSDRLVSIQIQGSRLLGDQGDGFPIPLSEEIEDVEGEFRWLHGQLNDIYGDRP